MSTAWGGDSEFAEIFSEIDRTDSLLEQSSWWLEIQELAKADPAA